jgi:hypothetical protein
MNKKNILRIFCLTLLILVGFFPLSFRANVAQAQSGNVVLNPSFETAGSGGAADAANWTEGTNHTRASDRFHTGAWSLKSTFTGGGTSTNQSVTVQTNRAYTYSGWIWRQSTTGGSCMDMNDIAGEVSLCTGTTGSWQFVSGTWNSGSNTSITLRLITDGTPNNSIWFDDISLVSTTPTATNTSTRTNTPTNTPITPTFLPPTVVPPANVVLNPSFETAGLGGAADAANWTEGTNHTRASDRFHTGGWSLKSTFTGAGTSTNQTVSVSANSAYTYSGWIWRQSTTGGSCMDMSDIAGEVTLCTSTTGSWQFVTGTWNSGSNTSITLRLITDATPNNSIWFDDISLIKPGGPTLTPTKTNTPTLTPPPSSGGVLGNTIVGYQGWFAAAGDGSTYNTWFHWSNGGVPGPGNLKFELYPDVREYTTLFQTNFSNLGNGSPARVFSSYTAQTVNVHFKWMKDNNIDGAALQRFGSDLVGATSKAFRDSVTTKVRTAAEANGRIFYIMYDASGMGTNFVSQLQNDWTNTIVPMNLTASPMYAKQNGKPVVCLWGIGFSDRPGSASDWTTLINWFKNQGVYVIGGVPPTWRTSGTDLKPGFTNVWPTLNMIQPWVVGRYGTDAEVDSYKTNFLIPDRDYTAARGIDYQPIAFPGFAWSNWNGGTRNQIPRRQGNLFWRQVYNIKSANLSTLYIAMFDEYDEGTAIAKAAEDSSMIPTNQYFLTLDADGVHLSADYYLRLAGAANRMLKGQIPLSLTIPIPNQ